MRLKSPLYYKSCEHEITYLPFRDIMSIGLGYAKCDQSKRTPLLTMACLDALASNLDPDQFGPQSPLGQTFLRYKIYPRDLIAIKLDQNQSIFEQLALNINQWQRKEPLWFNLYGAYYDSVNQTVIDVSPD
jgi:hypothetical protein